jgi:hypothetical protein
MVYNAVGKVEKIYVYVKTADIIVNLLFSARTYCEITQILMVEIIFDPIILQ